MSKQTGTLLSELLTPALVLDKARLAANIEKKKARASMLGVTLRPHLKTCKSVDVASALGELNCAAVSTLTELKVFFEHGIQNLRFTAPFPPAKLRVVAPLIRKGLQFELLVDDPDMLSALSAQANAEGVQVSVVIELDCDEVRGGVKPQSDRFEALLNVIASSEHLKFEGLYSYAGATYGLSSAEDRVALIEKHRQMLCETASRLKQLGLTLRTIGIGSSPALENASSFEGLTEACAGVFVFQDLAQRGIGVTTLDEIAVGVLASVVQHKPDCGRIFIDAGGLALAQDRSTHGQKEDQGYGLVCNALSRQPIGNGDVIVKSVSQEHGIITLRDGSPAPAELLPVGSQVWIMPNHACMTVNPYPGYHVIEENAVTEFWPKVSGWTLD